MFGSSMLDIAVGVVFTFLLFSIFATALNELVASIYTRRGEFLLRGIQAILDDEPQFEADATSLFAAKAKAFSTWLGRLLGRNMKDPDGKNNLSQALYESGQIFGLYRGPFKPGNYGNLPSYIPASNFASALLDVSEEVLKSSLKAYRSTPTDGGAPPEAAVKMAFNADKTPYLTLNQTTYDAWQADVAAAKAAFPDPAPVVNGQATSPPPIPIRQEIIDAAFLLAHCKETAKVGRPLTALIQAAGNDLTKLQAGIEAWYNSAMDRVSGQYKYKTQWALFTIGLLMAVVLNANTIAIVQQISKDPTLRASLVAAASSAPNPTPQSTNTGDEEKKGAPATGDTSDPISQRIKDAHTSFAAIENIGLPIGWPTSGHPKDTLKVRSSYFMEWLGDQPLGEMFLGWLLTAIAVSVGAPFWFDALNKIMVIRSTVKPAEKSQPEKSKS